MTSLFVYGSSIFLAGVAARLEAAMAGVKIVQRQTLNNLEALNSFDAVVIDLNDPTSADVLRLVRARPDLRLIGLNAVTNAFTVLSGEVYFTPTFTEIIARLGEQMT